MKQVLESQYDITTMTLMNLHPLITHKNRAAMKAITFDQEDCVVESDAGIRYVLYYTDHRDNRMFELKSFHQRKRVELKADQPVRVLVVTDEGNFATFILSDYRRV